MEEEGLDERGDGRFVGFDGWRMAQVAEGLRGDGAYRGEGGGWGQGKAGSFEKGDEVAGCGSAGKGYGVGIGGRSGEESLQRRDGFWGNLVAVGVGHGEIGSSGGEHLGKNVAGFGGADEEEALSRDFRGKNFGKGFGYVLWGDEIDLKADSLHRASG